MEGITITRTFDAPVSEVWKAWTDPDLVKKWWGPKDFYAPSIRIDFRVGGKYVYAMHGPSGSQWDKDFYSAGTYKEIVPLQKIVAVDYFADENGEKTSPTAHGLPPDMPSEMNVTVRFEDLGENKSKLYIEYSKPKSEAQFEVMKKTGMEEGWGTSLDKLASVVEKK